MTNDSAPRTHESPAEATDLVLTTTNDLTVIIQGLHTLPPGSHISISVLLPTPDADDDETDAIV